LWDAVLGTLDNSVPNVVVADRIQELVKNVVVSELRHILHRDEVGLRLIDETAELCDKSPLGVRARFPAFTAVGGERLARRTPGQQGVCITRPDCEQIISGNLTNVLVNELGVVVRLVWESALRVDVETSKDGDAPSDKTMSKATNATEKVDARNHKCVPTLWAPIRADEEQFVDVFLERGDHFSQIVRRSLPNLL
jgi:hypothetical protein